MNKRKKIVVGLILGIILVCNICGCQSNKEEKNSILRVGIVTYTQDDPFINAFPICLECNYGNEGYEDNDLRKKWRQ